MKKRNYLESFGFIAIMLMMFNSSCTESQEIDDAIDEPAISIRGLEISPVSREVKKIFTGTLEGEQQAVIRAKISEAVENVSVVEGEYVSANTVIINLYKAGPSSNFLQSRSVYQNAEKNYKKMEYLYKEGAVSESQYDGAKTEYEVAHANFEAARQTVELRTPIPGTVTSIDVSAGDYVSPGQQVATVATIDKLRIRLGVNAGDIGFFTVGDTVRILVESKTGYEAGGVINMVAESADPITRTFQVEIEINNSDQIFKPGMFARAEVVTDRFNNIIAVSQTTVLNRNNRDFVYIISGDRAIIKEVTMGTDFGGEVQIKSGINVGDTVVTLGQDYLTDSSLIKLTTVISATGEEL